MIGLALVTLVATLAAGIIQPFKSAVNELFTADYSITAQNNFSPIPPSAANAVANAPDVLAVSSMRGGDGRAFNHTIQVTGVQPNLGDVITSTKWQDGSPAVFRAAGRGRHVRRQGYAKGHHLAVGSQLDAAHADRHAAAADGEGDLQAAERRLAVRHGDDLAGARSTRTTSSRRTCSRS